MIDTDKYEGHTEGPWYWDGNLDEHSEENTVLDWEHGVEEVNARLIADAPLLLAEVKRLQKELRKQTNIVGMISDLVYDGGSHNLTWDELNEILGDVVKE